MYQVDSYFQFVLLPVDNNRDNVLFNKDYDNMENGWDGGKDDHVPGTMLVQERDDPATIIPSC